MKLDRRIENESLIYTPVTTSKPKLHEKGYFADDMLAFANLAECVYGELSGYDIKLKYPYRCKHDDNILALAYCYHSFFIPESRLESKVKGE